VSTSLLVSTGAVSCYPASMVNLIWFADEECLSCQLCATWDTKSGISQSKNSTFLQAQFASALSCSNMWKSNNSHRFLWLQL